MTKIILYILILAFTMSGQIENEFKEFLRGLEDQFDIPNIPADSMQNEDFLLLDTRENEEYEVSHIKDALLVGYDEFDISLIDTVFFDKKIVVYCSVGYRSSKIAYKLYERGFKNVYNLYGGIFKWVNEGRIIVSGKEKTLNLHAYDQDWGRYITNPDIHKIF